MKEFIFPKDNRTIRQYENTEVGLNIDDDCTLEFEYCRATSLLYIRRKSFYSDKLSHFDDTDALIRHLTVPPIKQRRTTNERKYTPQTAHNAANNTEGTATSQPTPSADNALNFDPENCVDVIAFDEDGNITERSRSVEGIKRSYNAIRHKVESTVNVQTCNSFFLSPTLDTYPTFVEKSKVVATYAHHLKRKYDNFKAGFIFLEPCEDGSWHAHLIVCFYDFYDAECQLETFKDDTLKWWSKRNKKTSDYQIRIRKIVDLEDLEHTLDYLNPLSDKQDCEDDGKTTKRERLHYYPLWCKPMRCFGDVVDSVKGTAKKEDINSLVAEEFEGSRRRKRTEVYDTQTGEMIYFVEEFVCVVKDLHQIIVDQLHEVIRKVQLEEMQKQKGWHSQSNGIVCCGN